MSGRCRIESEGREVIELRAPDIHSWSRHSPSQSAKTVAQLGSCGISSSFPEAYRLSSPIVFSEDDGGPCGIRYKTKPVSSGFTVNSGVLAQGTTPFLQSTAVDLEDQGIRAIMYLFGDDYCSSWRLQNGTWRAELRRRFKRRRE